MRPNSRRRACRLLAVALVSASLLATTATHAEGNATEHDRARPRPKPDLVVTGKRVKVFHGPAFFGWFALGGQTHDVVWFHDTMNNGPGASKPSRTSVAFRRPDGWRNLASLPVRGLAPGATHSDSSVFTATFNDRWDYGTYPVRLCADVLNVVAERNEKNNCRRLRPIYVAPTDLEGEVRGVAHMPALWPGVRLRWHGDVTYNVSPIDPRAANQGGFDYRWAAGQVTFSLEGGAGGCTWSGTRRLRPYHREPISLQFGRDAHYRAALAIGPEFHVKATRTCVVEGRVDIAHMDFYPFRFFVRTWLYTDEQDLLDPGVTRLVGTRSTGDRRTGSVRYVWDLRLKGADQ